MTLAVRLRSTPTPSMHLQSSQAALRLALYRSMETHWRSQVAIADWLRDIRDSPPQGSQSRGNRYNRLQQGHVRLEVLR